MCELAATAELASLESQVFHSLCLNTGSVLVSRKPLLIHQVPLLSSISSEFPFHSLGLFPALITRYYNYFLYFTVTLLGPGLCSIHLHTTSVVSIHKRCLHSYCRGCPTMAIESPQAHIRSFYNRATGLCFLFSQAPKFGGRILIIFI